MRKTKDCEATLYEIVEGFKGEVESLLEEIGEWRGNLEGNSMEHLPKYEEVSECCDELEAIEADSLEVPEGVSASVSWTEFAAKKKTSRAARANYAATELEAAASFLEDLTEGTSLEGKYEDFLEDLQSKAEALRAVSFPGMF